MPNFLLVPLTDVRELTFSSIFMRLFFAALIGGILGMERGHKNRPA